jgi:hypothetical protein
MDLSFQEIGPIVELSADECAYEKRQRDDPSRWLLIQADQLVERPPDCGPSSYQRVEPIQLVAFSTLPGAGCEAANFGLCRYPALVATEVNGRQRTVHTGLSRQNTAVRRIFWRVISRSCECWTLHASLAFSLAFLMNRGSLAARLATWSGSLALWFPVTRKQ